MMSCLQFYQNTEIAQKGIKLKTFQIEWHNWCRKNLYPDASFWSRSAPHASNSRTQSKHPPLAAKCRGVLPGQLKFDTYLVDNSSHNLPNPKQWKQAHPKRVNAKPWNYPYPPVKAQTRPPLSKRIWTHLGRLCLAARCKGVAPWPSLMFTNRANPLQT